MRLALAIALGCAVPATARGDNETDHPCIGRWIGTGQNSGSRPWGIDLRIGTTRTTCGEIQYDSPDLDCGGPLLECTFGESDGRARERYDHNRHCAPAGRIDFTCRGDRMTWTWYGDETLTFELRRVEGTGPRTTGTPADDAPRGEPSGDGTDPPREVPNGPHDPGTPDPPADRARGVGCGCTASDTTAAGALAFFALFALLLRPRSFR